MVNNKRILVISSALIDDDRFKCNLHESGYEVAFARDGLTAVQMAILFEPDLVLLEDLAAEVNLFLACSAIRDLHDRPKLIVCTNQPNEYTAKTLGADEVLIKPVGEWELMSCIDRNLWCIGTSHQLPVSVAS